MVEESVQSKLAVVGGGITGLSAAYFALKQGVPGDQINVYESSDRLGGKIESAMLDGKVVNKGAEFVDTDYHQFIGLCNELGVKLTDATDQKAMTMQRPSGSTMSEARFMREYQPLADIMLRHKAELAAQPYGALARRLDAMSVDEYVDALGAQVRGNIFQRFFHFITFRPSVSHEILEMLKQSYVSEGCHAAERLSALQFVHESGAQPGELRVSDCAYRVEGGTEQLIHALRAKLEQAGVHFHYGAQVAGLSKQGNATQLSFADGSAATSDKVILALPTYALSNIQGLDALGMSPQAQSLIGGTQYTNAIKFTVKLKDGVQLEHSNFFSTTGFQSWPGQPGQLTFLCSADRMNGSMSDFMRQAMDQYAKAYHTTAEALFDVSGPGKIVLTNPGKGQCYASPGPGQALQLERLSGSMDRLADNGIGIAGTFLPMHEKTGMGIGFMECGVSSARLAAAHLLTEEKSPVQWAARVRAQQIANDNARSGALIG